MKVRITEAGWETFTGDLGTVQFEGGESLTDIPHLEALALGAYIQVVELDDAGAVIGIVSPGVDMVRFSSVAAEVEAPLSTLKEINDAAAAKVRAEQDRLRDMEAAGPSEKGPITYTQESLEAIASEKGIGGLREIADKLEVKGTSIRGLIAEILLRNPPAH